ILPAGVAGIDVIFRKYSGNSGFGVNNVANATVLANDSVNHKDWVDFLTCRATVLPFVIAATPRWSQFALYTNCPATTIPKVPHGLLSDIELPLLGVTPFVQSQLVGPGGEVGDLGVAIAFAPIVSTPLYTALQAAEHLTACDAFTQTPACMPNLSSTQLR